MNIMPYPSKIDSQAIVDGALSVLQREGQAALTLRRLAKEVGVTPNAFYRYFSSFDALIAAAADAVARRLYLAIEQGTAELPDDADEEARVRKLLKVYSDFAESNPTLYRTFLSAKAKAAAELPQPRYHELLWPKVVSIVEPLVGSDDAPAATVTLWGLLHGIWALRQADVLGGKKPSEIDDYAFDALIQGLRSLRRRSGRKS
jgi:AcrR family transcriptional regulator